MPRPLSTETRSARIRRVRIAAPVADGRFCLNLADGERVAGRVEDPAAASASLAALSALVRRGAELSLGLYRLDDGSAWLHWAVGDDGQGLIPPSRAALRSAAARGLARWLPALALALAGLGGALWRIFDGFGWALLLVACAVAGLIAAIMVFEHAATLHRSRRDRRVAAASEQALAQALRLQGRPTGESRPAPDPRRRRGRRPAQAHVHAQTSVATAQAAPDLPPPAVPSRTRDPAAPDRPDHPRLRRWQGELSELTMEQIATGSSDSRRSFGLYRFRLGGQRFRFYAARDFGDHEPFLAEADRVELIAHGEPAQTGEEVLVYALHCLEDGRRYVAHTIFLARYSEQAMTRLTWPGMRRMARFLLAAGLGVVALIAAIGLCTAGGEDFGALLTVAAIFAGVVPGVLLLGFAVSRWRWRRGAGGRRRATAARVYAAMDLGPPWAWRLPADAVEV
ncbi:hypothetical protein K4L06_06455 [Lysobacter sp. BMK333-48F3]|uniref:hypothetical protein n=1 Tax=Lysobacter sp. BMK333-48F3 TaxID=2867962 RepID=UPI001C8B9E0F|nr:hypothetical protein [Lysobacter sp. BMK333-48F3]MBX9400948.1 hypothetical protein [Lysobacter sp. BMK333-48F3]